MTTVSGRIGLRGFFIMVILFDLFLFLLYALGEYHEIKKYLQFSGQSTIQYLDNYPIKTVTMSFAGFQVITNMLALFVSVRKDVRQAQRWALLLLPHLLANFGMIIVRLVHAIQTTLNMRWYNKQWAWHLWMCSLLPFMTWHAVVFHLTYMYFRKISLAELDDGNETEDVVEENPALRLPGMAKRLPDLTLSWRTYIILLTNLDFLYVVTLVYFFVVWILRIRSKISSYVVELYYIDWVILIICCILMLSDLITLAIAIVKSRSKARRFRILLIPGIISHGVLPLLLAVAFVYIHAKDEALDWDRYFPHLVWHVLAGTISFLFHRKLATHVETDGSVSSYRELMEQSA